MTKRTVQLPDLTDATVIIGTATAYSFRFKWGWAIFTINDATGEFSVQSDWGNWCYRWSPKPEHLGSPTLTLFLARTNDPWYVANKFHYGRRDDEMFDTEATERLFKLMVGEEYKDGCIDLEQARELIRLLDDLDWETEESFMRTFYDDLDELKVLSEEPYTHVVKSPTPQFTILTEALLPFFFDYLRREVTKGTEKAA